MTHQQGEKEKEDMRSILESKAEALEHHNNRPKIEDIKLTPYHQEQNKREAEANKTMPKISTEEFKKQVQKLKDHRKAQGN